MGCSNGLSYQAISSTHTQSQLCTATPISLFVLIEFWLKILNFSLKIGVSERNVLIWTYRRCWMCFWFCGWYTFWIFSGKPSNHFYSNLFHFYFFSVCKLLTLLWWFRKKKNIVKNLTTSLDKTFLKSQLTAFLSLRLLFQD